MKRRIQLEIYEEIKDMTPDEQAAYFRSAFEGDSELAEKSKPYPFVP